MGYTTITIVERPGGWEAMNYGGLVPETVTIGLRQTAEQVEAVVAKMIDAGMINADVEIVRSATGLHRRPAS